MRISSIEYKHFHTVAEVSYSAQNAGVVTGAVDTGACCHRCCRCTLVHVVTGAVDTGACCHRCCRHWCMLSQVL